MSLPEHLKLPAHVAIIMDGNGRWATKRGLKRLDGHKEGAKSVKAVVESCRRIGIPYLTLYSFSTENWFRPAEEVYGLMSIFKRYLDEELDKLLEHGIRLRAIGDLERLPAGVRASLDRSIEKTSKNSALNLTLALSYGSREELAATMKKIAEEIQAGKLDIASIDISYVSSRLWTHDLPDPDLLIRTSGEIRISNFLLWQIAYTEIVVVEELWPDFSEKTFESCLVEYSKRDRRYGRISSDSN